MHANAPAQGMQIPLALFRHSIQTGRIDLPWLRRDKYKTDCKSVHRHLRKALRPEAWIYTGKKTDLLSSDGTDPGKAGVDCLGYRHWLCTKQGMELGFWNCERICFFHGVRDEIVPSGQHFPDRTHLGGDMFDAVNDRSVWSTENNIAVFAHDLHDQILAAKIAKLIQMLDCKMNDPF